MEELNLILFGGGAKGPKTLETQGATSSSFGRAVVKNGIWWGDEQRGVVGNG